MLYFVIFNESCVSMKLNSANIRSFTRCVITREDQPTDTISSVHSNIGGFNKVQTRKLHLPFNDRSVRPAIILSRIILSDNVIM